MTGFGYRVAADLVVFAHLLFILFVASGGFLAWRWPRLAWVHVPCAVWGSFVALAGRICPLTPLENALRARAGAEGYTGGFIEHYIIPLIYPGELTRELQVALGAGAVLANLVAYGVLLRRHRAGSLRTPRHSRME